MTFLLYGINDFVINQEIGKIIKKYNIVSDDIINYYETPIIKIIEDAQIISLFNDYKLIIVNDCTLFESNSKKEEINILENYLSKQNETAILLLIEKVEKVDERKKIFKILKENKCVIECNIINLNNLIVENLDGYGMSESVINNFINRVGNNPYNILNELEKLKTLKFSEKVIDDNDILFATKNIEENIFDLINYIINKDSENIMMLYNNLLLRNSEPIAILILIANQFRLMFQVKRLSYQGYSEKEIASILEIHPYRVKLAISKSKLYDEKLLLNYLENLADLDYGIKSGQIDINIGLELFLLGL